MKKTVFGIILFSIIYTTPTMTQSFNYTQAWEEIDQLKNERKDHSVIENLRVINKNALKDNNTLEIYKTHHEIGMLSENINEFIIELENKLGGLKSPSLELSHLQLAHLYKNSKSRNAYEIGQRTHVEGGLELRSIDEYSTFDYQQKILDHFELALNNSSATNINADGFEEMFFENKNLLLQNFNLYEIVLNHYLDHLTESGINANKQKLEADKLLSTKTVFETELFENLDPNATSYKQIVTIKELLRLSEDDERKTLFYDLKRLQIFHNYLGANANEKYNEAIEELAIQNVNKEIYPYVYSKVVNTQLGKAGNDYSKLSDIVEKLEQVINDYEGGFGISELKNALTQLQTEIFYVDFEHTYALDERIEYNISHKNIDKLYFKMIVLNKEDADFISNYRNSSANKIDRFSDRTAFKTWEEQLSRNAYHQDGTDCKAIGVDKSGKYGIFTSKSQDFSESIQLTVVSFSDLTYSLYQGTELGTRYIVKNRKSGKPIKNATVHVYEQKYNRTLRSNEYIALGSFKSNKNGQVNLPYENKNISIKIEYKGDSFHPNENIYTRGNVIRRDDYIEEVFYMDRAIYRPGQTVYFKTLSLRHQGTEIGIIGNRNLTISLFDANNQLINSVKGKTNDYGSFSSTFQLPQNILSGYYTIRGAQGSQRFTVQEYKRPSFELSVDTVSGGLKLGDEILVGASAKGYAGNSITSVEYSYQVYRYLAYPRCYYWFPPQQSDRLLVASGFGETDAQGLINLGIIDDKPIYPFPKNRIVSYEINIRVIDAAGETQEISKTINVSPQEFYLRPDLKEEYDVSGVIPVTIEAFDANNNSIYRAVKVEIYKFGNRKFVKSQPWNYTTNELNNTDDDVLVDEQNLTTKGEVSLKGLKYGDYRMKIEGISEEGDTISYSKDFSITNFERGKFTNKKLLYTRTNKNKFEVGEKLELNIGSSTKIYADVFIVRNEEVRQFKQKKINHKRNFDYLISEEDRGGLTILVNFIFDNRHYTERIGIEVPHSDKQLKVEYLTFRDLTKPGTEEIYSIKISPKLAHLNKSSLPAEVLVGMYDASLDAFVEHQWRSSYYGNNYARLQIQNGIFGRANYITAIEDRPFDYEGSGPLLEVPRFKLIEYFGGRMMRSRAASPMMMEAESDMAMDADGMATNGLEKKESNEESVEESITVQVRTNLNETVFFYPHLMTNEKGELTYEFKMNDALTRWKLLTFAHNKDFAIGYDMREVVTQKELMIKANTPRLMRLGDELWLTASVSNLTESKMPVEVFIALEDGLRGESLDHLLKSEVTVTVELNPGETKAVKWLINSDVPNLKLGAIKYTVSASSDNHTDAEVNVFPLISNQIQLVSTLPMTIRGNEQKKFEFKDFIEGEGIANDMSYTLELSLNPAWFAIQALPHQILESGEYTSLIANKIYAYSLGQKLFEENKDIGRILKANKAEKNEMVTFLNKNQELKNVLLESTPWVVESIEEQNTANALYQFTNENQVTQNIEELLGQLKVKQNSDGGFAWYKGTRSNDQTTLSVSKNLIKVRAFSKEIKVDDILFESAKYLTERMQNRYADLKRRATNLDEFSPSRLDIEILLLLAELKELNIELNDISIEKTFYLKQAKKYWTKFDNGKMAMIGLLFLNEDDKIASLIKESFVDRLNTSEELGAYLYEDMRGNNLNAHVDVMDFLLKSKVEPTIINEMKIWLIKHKQVNSWGNASKSIRAIEGLLLNGSNKEVALISDEAVTIKFGGKDYDVSEINKAGGYFKHVWNNNPLDRNMGNIKVTNHDDQVIYGAAFWKYIEDMDKVVSNQNSPLKLEKSMYRKILINNKEVLQPIDAIDLKIGDVVVSRIVIESDRTYDFLHLQDFRGAGLEPRNQVSKYEYAGSFSYFKEIKDVAANYFIDHLPKGKFVVENENVVVYKGQYSAGIARIQSYHSSEFNAFSNGLNIKVK